jgi:hypothetical protein
MGDQSNASERIGEPFATCATLVAGGSVAPLIVLGMAASSGIVVETIAYQRKK